MYITVLDYMNRAISLGYIAKVDGEMVSRGYVHLHKQRAEQQGVLPCHVWGNKTLATLFVNKIAQLC